MNSFLFSFQENVIKLSRVDLFPLFVFCLFFAFGVFHFRFHFHNKKKKKNNQGNYVKCILVFCTSDSHSFSSSCMYSNWIGRDWCDFWKNSTKKKKKTKIYITNKGWRQNIEKDDDDDDETFFIWFSAAYNFSITEDFIEME